MKAITLVRGSLLAATCAVLFGCGGGGGSTLGGSGGNNTARIFITDDLNAGYDGVWVNIHEVELINAAGSSVKVFDSDAGTTVNLRALNDGSARFLFLGQGQIPDGSYSRIEVTMDKALTLFPTGASTGISATFTNDIDAGAGRSKAKLTLGTPLIFPGSGQNLVVDFDLASWTFNSGVVTPVVRRFTGGGLDDNTRHENEDYKGTISGLSGTVPNQSFTLTRGAAGTFRVQLSASTAVFRDNGAGSAALVDGLAVEVRGTVDASSGVLSATDVKIEDGTQHEGEPQVKGAVKSFSAAGGNLVVSASQVEGFLPGKATVNVSTSPSTLYFGDRGNRLTESEFFAAVANGSVVEAEGGSYDASSNTLSARKIKFEDGESHEHGNEAEAKGDLSNLDSSARTFDLNLDEWEGFQATAGSSIHVTAQSGATYQDDRGRSVSQDAFFAKLSAGVKVKLHGSFANGTLAANRFELK